MNSPSCQTPLRKVAYCLVFCFDATFHLVKLEVVSHNKQKSSSLLPVGTPLDMSVVYDGCMATNKLQPWPLSALLKPDDAADVV